MARPQYPSDEARRKTRPHMRVHLTVATHRRTAAAWSDLELRAMLVELWRFAREAHAHRTENVVILSRAACQSIAGRSRHAHNVEALRRLCKSVGYDIADTDAGEDLPDLQQPASDPLAPCQRGAGVLVRIRKFAEKQGLDSAERGAPPRTPPPSERRGEERSSKRRERRSAAHSDAADAAPSPADREAPPRRNPIVNLLSGKNVDPPVEPDERESWLEALEPEIQAAAEFEARAALNGADPPTAAVSAAFKRIVLPRWRVYLRGERIYRTAAADRERAAKRRAWEADHGDEHQLALLEGEGSL